MRTKSVTFALVLLVCSAAAVFGGGTFAGLSSDSILTTICAIVLMVIASSLSPSLPAFSRRSIALLIAIIALVFAAQLLPLGIGARLVGSGAGTGPDGSGGNAAVSVAPHLTWIALVSLLPPLAVFVGVAALNDRERLMLASCILAFGVAASALGIVQMAQGTSSPLRFYSLTNTTEAVGFFANRNHYSAFLNGVLALWAASVLAWFSSAPTDWIDGRRPSQWQQAMQYLPITGLFLGGVVLLAAQLAARSRVGIAFTLLILIVTVALAIRRDTSVSPMRSSRLLGAGLVFAAIFALDYAVLRFAERLTLNPLEDARLIFARNTWTAAKSFLPFGAGFGTFPVVYGSFAAGTDEIATFANRAHNDFLEWFLEAGALAPVILVVFGVWFVKAVFALTAEPARDTRLSTVADNMGRLLPWAGALIVVSLLAHSAFDYPLRTAGNMALFAVGCGLLLPAVPEVLRRQRRRGNPVSPKSAHAPTYGASVSAPPRAEQNAPIDWPEAWKPRDPT